MGRYKYTQEKAGPALKVITMKRKCYLKVRNMVC